MSLEDFYQILEVLSTATTTEIKTAYRKKALQLHPDKNPKADAVEKFQQIGRAWEHLGNDYRRIIYDTKWKKVYGDIPKKNDGQGARVEPDSGNNKNDKSSYFEPAAFKYAKSNSSGFNADTPGHGGFSTYFHGFGSQAG